MRCEEWVQFNNERRDRHNTHPIQKKPKKIMSIVKQFMGNKILSSAEFVKLFKRYDKDGRCNTKYVRKVAAKVWTELRCRPRVYTSCIYGRHFHGFVQMQTCILKRSRFVFASGNGQIETSELDLFLKDLCDELGSEVRYTLLRTLPYSTHTLCVRIYIYICVDIHRARQSTHKTGKCTKDTVNWRNTQTNCRRFEAKRFVRVGPLE